MKKIKLLKEYDDLIDYLQKNATHTYYYHNAFNEIVTTHENMILYLSTIAQQKEIPENIAKRLPAETIKRFVNLNKKCFIQIMSSFEYDLRLFVRKCNFSFFQTIKNELENGKPVDLLKILQIMKNKNLIHSEDFLELRNIHRIRNILVHNDGRPTDLDYKKSFIDKFFTKFVIGEQIEGYPTNFICIIKIINQIYEKWHLNQKTIYEKIQSEIDVIGRENFKNYK